MHHYFGTKQQLFIAASEFPVDPAELVPRMLAGPREQMGERVVRTVVGLWDRPEVRPMLLGIVRSATTDPVAAGMTRRMLAEGPFLALARAVDLPDAEIRATLGRHAAHRTGDRTLRHRARAHRVDVSDELAAAVGPTIGRYLAGDVRLTTGGERG